MPVPPAPGQAAASDRSAAAPPDPAPAPTADARAASRRAGRRTPDPAVATGRRVTWLFLLAAIAGVGGLALWCAVRVAGQVPEAYNFGDSALTELYTRYATEGIWGLGPYSRFGWHHPGPLYFYLLAPFYRLSGDHGLGLTAGASALALLSLILIAWALVRHARPATALVLFGAVALYVHQLPRVLTSLWNPHVLLLPYGALLIVSAVTASGRLSWLPPLMLLASFVAQTHVGLAPSAVLLALCALAAGLRHAPRETMARGLALGALALGLAWFPPIHQQLTEPDGNLAKLLAFFTTSAAESVSPTVPFRDAFAVWVATMLAAPRGALAIPYGSALSPRLDTLPFAALALIEVALLPIAAQWSARRGRLVEAWLCRITALAAVIALAAFSRVREQLVDYVTFWNSVTGLFAIALLAAMAVPWIAEWIARGRGGAEQPGPRLRAREWQRQWRHTAAPAFALIVIAIAALSALREIERHRTLLIEREVTPPVGRLAIATRQAIAAAGFARPRIEMRGDWSNAAGIILHLHKRDVPIGIDPSMAWMFGAPIASRGDERGIVIIARGELGRAAAAEPDDCLVSVVHQTSIHLRPPADAAASATPPGGVRCRSYADETR